MSDLRDTIGPRSLSWNANAMFALFTTASLEHKNHILRGTNLRFRLRITVRRHGGMHELSLTDLLTVAGGE